MTSVGSWKDAKDIAERDGKERVFHDFDTGEYGACSRSATFGHFERGTFIEHRCICMPAKFSVDELQQKENEFLTENPDWAEP